MMRIAAVLAALLALQCAAQPVTPPPIAARAFIVVDLLSGQTLAAENENDRFEPASLAKLMTAYVVFSAMREGKIDAKTEVKPSLEAAKSEGARMFIVAGNPVTVGELLNGMIVDSGNDAAVALAEAVAGSEAAFVERMNHEAQRLGLANTHFSNASGRPAQDLRSSARDLATLAIAVIRDFPDQYPLYSQKDFTYNKITQSNRNRLLWTDPTVDGMKAGFTETAGYCLVASARRGERRLVAVVLGAQSDGLRTTESQKLLNFGFQAFETRRMYRKGEPVATPAVFKGTKHEVSLGFDHDIWLTMPRSKFAGIAATLETRQPFVAPLAAGQKAGIMKLTRDNAPVAEIPVVALEEVPVAGFLSRGWDTLRLLFK